MSYKHKFSIKHLPKFAFGISLIIVTTAAVLGGLYVLLFTDQYTAGTIVLTGLNVFGMVMFSIIIADSVEYTITEIPDEELTSSQRLKKDLIE